MSTVENPYRTYEALWASRIKVVGAPNSAKLLFMPVQGTMQSAVEVLSDLGDLDTRTPYYDQAAGTYHPVSALPISEPKVSSITVNVPELEDWEENWLNLHEQHSEPDAPDAFPEAQWGKLSGSHGDEDEDEDDEPQLLRCCKQDRPRSKNAKLTIKPSKPWDGQDSGFVTVHDYVSAVHPWLVRLRNDILRAMGTADGLDEPLGNEMNLVANCDALHSLMMEPRISWIGHRKGLYVREAIGGKLRTSEIITSE
ncbi:uncharacterized protein CTRU02_210881 [Colletotrichum truncatum]|uniref:Uncharacterized protein n=1 Tax=Colletotrichum truncatum TaxID=5467 RepID=A0ACC3YSE9_COLTU|nr:uncharacterized protein CTRU02_03633 [Colletotrichum truncatum]KAF6796655.1 hypothetical protein CTRU02_03633 [Colletotrichum truncatum]